MAGGGHLMEAAQLLELDEAIPVTYYPARCVVLGR